VLARELIHGRQIAKFHALRICRYCASSLPAEAGTSAQRRS
jgi:hypothetical protein